MSDHLEEPSCDLSRHAQEGHLHPHAQVEQLNIEGYSFDGEKGLMNKD